VIEGVDKNERGLADAGEGRDERTRAREDRCDRRTGCLLDKHDDLTACVVVPISPQPPNLFLGTRARTPAAQRLLKQQQQTSAPFVWPVAGERYVDTAGRDLLVTSVARKDAAERHVVGVIAGRQYACSATTFEAVWRRKP
jgi:hypothetical protein